MLITTEREKIGVCHCTITEAQVIAQGENSGERLQLNLDVFTLNHTNLSVTLNIFAGNKFLSLENFAKFIECTDSKELMGKEFYARIEKNEKGFYELKKLIYKVAEDNPFFAPKKVYFNLDEEDESDPFKDMI